MQQPALPSLLQARTRAAWAVRGPRPDGPASFAARPLPLPLRPGPRRALQPSSLHGCPQGPSPGFAAAAAEAGAGGGRRLVLLPKLLLRGFQRVPEGSPLQRRPSHRWPLAPWRSSGSSWARAAPCSWADVTLRLPLVPLSLDCWGSVLSLSWCPGATALWRAPLHGGSPALCAWRPRELASLHGAAAPVGGGLLAVAHQAWSRTSKASPGTVEGTSRGRRDSTDRTMEGDGPGRRRPGAPQVLVAGRQQWWRAGARRHRGPAGRTGRAGRGSALPEPLAAPTCPRLDLSRGAQVQLYHLGRASVREWPPLATAAAGQDQQPRSLPGGLSGTSWSRRGGQGQGLLERAMVAGSLCACCGASPSSGLSSASALASGSHCPWRRPAPAGAAYSPVCRRLSHPWPLSPGSVHPGAPSQGPDPNLGSQAIPRPPQGHAVPALAPAFLARRLWLSPCRAHCLPWALIGLLPPTGLSLRRGAMAEPLPWDPLPTLASLCGLLPFWVESDGVLCPERPGRALPPGHYSNKSSCPRSGGPVWAFPTARAAGHQWCPSACGRTS